MTEIVKNRIAEMPEDKHLVGKFCGEKRDGATLIAVGSLHGNEPAGAAALEIAARELESISPDAFRGRVFLLRGNSRALKEKVRFINADLNRHWTVKKVKHNLQTDLPEQSEDAEQKELLEILQEIFYTATGEIYVIDLHSTSAAGAAFATVGDTMRNRRFAEKFPVRVLLGIEEQLDGTFLEHLNNLGAVTLGFEGGQHDAPETIKAHAALLRLALVNTGILTEEQIPDFELQKTILRDACKSDSPRVVEVRYRQAIAPEDEFVMNPGYQNFDEIKRGEILAHDKNGAIKARESGLILMPLYQKQGEDGFFIGRKVARVWLKLSAFLRRLKIGNLMPFLPGVRRHPFDPDVLFVDTRIARFFPLQIFHLLGFRKRRQSGNELVVSRRRHDWTSPFTVERRQKLWVNKKLRLNKTKTV